jgi:diacylglycerol O-acyltransferase / wax synthase
MSAIERLTGVDRAWLLMDRPTNPMIIVGLIMLAGALDRRELRKLVAERFLAFERFRCYPAADAMGASWVAAAQFDLDDHVLSVALPAGSGRHGLEALVGELASTPFLQGRPLWSFHLVEGLPQGCAIIVRIHHCYADGIALMQVLLALADGMGRARGHHPPIEQRSQPAEDTATAQGGALGMIPALLSGAMQQSLNLLEAGSGLLEQGIHFALHPLAASKAAWDAAASASELAHIGMMTDDPPTRLKGPLSGVRRLAWGDPISLEEVRTVGHVLGCTVNDVLVSTLAGALGRYLEACGEQVSGLTIRAAVPVDLRSADGSESLMGNRFGLVFVELPIGVRHPLERLYAVHTAMQRLKSSVQAPATLGLLSVVGNLPSPLEESATAIFSAKASLVASNLSGPREQLTLAGIPVSQVLFWVPQAGTIGTGVSMLSYNGRVQLGVISDRQLIPKPEELVAGLGKEFDRLVLLVLLGGTVLNEH